MQILDAQLSSIQEGRTVAEHPVEAALAEIEDLLSYCNDILANGEPPLCRCMTGIMLLPTTCWHVNGSGALPSEDWLNSLNLPRSPR